MGEPNITQSINKHKNMLIIGKGKTNYMLNKIAYFNTVEKVFESYGDSNLSQAFSVAKTFGAPYVFLMNVKQINDYFNIVTALKHNDFTYIVPVDLLMSDAYSDAYRNNKKITYLQYFLEEIGTDNWSTFVVTDKHAALYEDIDAFIDNMTDIITMFNSNAKKSLQGQNLIFVANNLANYSMSNVVLASVLCESDLNIYPDAAFGPAVFDIDIFDVGANLAFFKNNISMGTSVENLLNFNKVGPEKIVTIDRIIKYIKRELDFSEFKGKNFTGYQKLRISQKLTAFLESLKGYILDDFYIKSIVPYKSEPGTVMIITSFDIWPINSIEKCSVSTGVEI